MDVEEVRKRTHEFIDEVFNRKNIDYARDNLADDFVERAALPPGMPTDKEGALQFFQMMYAAFPDMRVDIHDLIVDGDKVAIVGTYHGTHKGEFMSIPATGKPVVMESIDIVRIDDDGMTHEHWGVFDMMGLMTQMGVIPAPDQKG